MQKYVCALIGLMLFAAGVAIGVAVMRAQVAQQQATPVLSVREEGRQDMARKKSATPTVSEDRIALADGVWVSSGEDGLIKITNYDEPFAAEAYLVNSEGSDFLIFDLAEIDGKRVLVEYYDENPEFKNPLYEYQLQGDRLELQLLHDAHSKIQDSRKHATRENLNGTWFRFRISK